MSPNFEERPSRVVSSTMAPTQPWTTEMPCVAPAPSLRHNHNFMALWSAQLFSQLADRVIFVVFVALIAKDFGANESYTSYLYIAFTIPAIFLTSVAGVFVDRWPRRATLVTTNLMRAGLIALLPWMSSMGLGTLYGLAFLLSAATQFFVPAEAATIPAIVPKHQLTSANSIFTTTMMGSIILGFAMGDPMINIFGLEGVHWGLVGLFTAAAILSMRLNLPPPSEATNPDLQARRDQCTSWPEHFQQFFSEIREGLDYIGHHKPVLLAMLKLALLFSAVVALCILSISFAKTYLYTDPALASRKFAYIVAVSGIGMAFGAYLVANPWHSAPRPLVVYSGMGLVGLALAGLCGVEFASPTIDALLFRLPHLHVGPLYLDPFPLTVRMAYTYAWSVVLGLGASMVSIPLQSFLHETIPEDKRGKVLGVQFTILSTSSTLPALLAGLGSEQLGVIPILLGFSVPFLGVCLWGYWTLSQKRPSFQ
jgi:MFS family permease